MKYFKLHPEVPADLGQFTLNDASDPPETTSTYLEFASPVRSEFFTSQSGVYAATTPLAAALAASAMTGFRLVPGTGVPTPHAQDPDTIQIPEFYGILINGKPGRDDFAIPHGRKGGLILSEQAADLLCARDPRLTETR
ncbi:hypothetical protein [Nocardia sp. NPDC050175]|uniref:hypothetical protein n=1 Tax=Nocardia sp. NPDC050175 TaxID=3364317 RepID=UPI00378BAB0E